MKKINLPEPQHNRIGTGNFINQIKTSTVCKRVLLFGIDIYASKFKMHVDLLNEQQLPHYTIMVR